MLKIISDVFNAIMRQLPDTPPEIGGVIGGKGGVIFAYEMDEGNKQERLCSYAPNVNYVNEVIRKWTKANIDFYGIFHVHFFGIQSLSFGDIAYMNQIIAAMPPLIDKLYFPLFVLPEQEMLLYSIEKQRKEVCKVPFEIIN